MSSRNHWEGVYATKPADTVSWYQPSAERSVAFIQRAVPDRSAAIIDVGGGASVLTGDLLAAGYQRLTVLDLSASALETARARLGDSAARVQWIEGDIRSAALPAHAYSLWHDRAVFHFLTEARDREAYRVQLRRALHAGGFALIATFAEDGPTTCSGLPVARYSVEQLRDEMGPSFQLVEHEREVHRTPAGRTQSFIYCLFRVVTGDTPSVQEQ